MRKGGTFYGCEKRRALRIPIVSLDSVPTLRCDELSSGKEALEARVGRPVETFAYPNGKRDDYDEEVMSEVRACGFELACTALFGSNTPAVDPYELRSQPLRYDARRGRAPNRGFLLPSVTRRPAR